MHISIANEHRHCGCESIEGKGDLYKTLDNKKIIMNK